MDRFWSKVDKRDDNQCWNWTGACNKWGYGQFGFNKKVVGAHRVSYELANGAIPEKMFILHSCDNRKCVNPAHLRTGTQTENIQEAVAKRRIKHGEDHCRALLLVEDILLIRKMYESGVTQKVLGERFDTDPTNIWKIVNRKSWRHI